MEEKEFPGFLAGFFTYCAPTGMMEKLRIKRSGKGQIAITGLSNISRKNYSLIVYCSQNAPAFPG